ncbi:yippee-domain-containing protein [Mytilinidion resinicola]|uniref:Yippee-domain-containing protein n=1 Tax=Mytilinidion resinicola TaxID=574789 RepID=A0A6A6YJ02_9PEZI|nr:yippee-domain-containing protein [Mytilinidion resinicola]KAF2807935.1 yippee-domain-containing protein [Mytilinidion resinicola]
MPFSSPSPPAIFPLYLFPSLPFRRRSSTSTSAASPPSLSSSPSSTISASPPRPSYLTGSSSHLRCAGCLTDLCPTASIISKGFTGRHGRAYLVAPPSPPVATSLRSKPGDLPNTHTHKAVPRQLVTGAHTVSDISCAHCGTVLGWKYVAADEESQRYKVGKFILETKRVCRAVDWEREEDELEVIGESAGFGIGLKAEGKEDDIQFDSQDEDECEDLFAGIWSPQLAKKRRRNRKFLNEEV